MKLQKNSKRMWHQIYHMHCLQYESWDKKAGCYVVQPQQGNICVGKLKFFTALCIYIFANDCKTLWILTWVLQIHFIYKANLKNGIIQIISGDCTDVWLFFSFICSYFIIVKGFASWRLTHFPIPMTSL